MSNGTKRVNYAKIATEGTPQVEALPGQKQNSAGGFSWTVDDWERMKRFLIMGSEGGSYYATEGKLTRENARAVERCIAADGPRAVQLIVDVSQGGRAPKNDQAVFALAMATKALLPTTRMIARAAIPDVCRTGTHLFQFVDAVQSFGGWGRGTRSAIARWYNRLSADQAAYQCVKYQSRERWSHRDLLRLAHAVPQTDAHDALFAWVTNREKLLAPVDMGGGNAEGDRAKLRAQLPRIVEAFEEAKTASPTRLRDLIREYGLPREALPSEALAHPETWEALLEGRSLPMGVMVRNLANMTRAGLLQSGSDSLREVTARLRNQTRISEARLHPIAILAALLTYKSGHGARGHNVWEPVPQVVDALDDAFYLAFEMVEPSGASTMLAIDVSGSMDMGTVAGVLGLTPRIASACMAMVTARAEKDWRAVGFSHRLVDLDISPRRRLDDVVRYLQGIPMGGTDCSLPMLEAARHSVGVDTFAVYTDSETWCGAIHPAEALRRYRQTVGRPAKLIVAGMMSNEFTIADPNDAGMLDVVGFDTAAPSVIADFSRPRALGT